ncbi:hypothetical protein LCGC14_2301270 [marine sediment metagenome]|uniref:Uncharacterized protein n=1 Tax=marine sediment metagenome TaxID=412755 RepID=A0A0F9FID5_9ZZZZ
MVKTRKFLWIALSVIYFVLPLEALAQEPFGFNPLLLELGSSSEYLEEEHPSLELIEEDYRSFGTGRVMYMSEFYDRQVWLILVTKSYLIEGILTAFNVGGGEYKEEVLAYVQKRMRQFDNNDKVEVVEVGTGNSYKWKFIHDDYIYVVHISNEIVSGWAIFVTKTYKSMGF